LPPYNPPSPTFPYPVASTIFPANATPLPAHVTSNSEPPYRFWSQAEDATLCRMLSEGSFHKDIAKVLSRSIVAIDQRVAKLRGKGQSSVTCPFFRICFQLVLFHRCTTSVVLHRSTAEHYIWRGSPWHTSRCCDTFTSSNYQRYNSGLIASSHFYHFTRLYRPNAFLSRR